MSNNIEIEYLNIDSLSKEILKKEANRVCDGVKQVEYDTNLKTDFPGSLFDDGKVLYLNSTDNIRIGEFVKPGDSFATVLAGGDFVLDAIYNGVNNIFTFDVNKFQVYPAMLKMLGLQHMDFEEYIKFFSHDNDVDFLSLDVFNKLKSMVGKDMDVLTFFDVYLKRLLNERMKLHRIIDKNPTLNILDRVINKNEDAGYPIKCIAQVLMDQLHINKNNKISDSQFATILSLMSRNYDKPDIFNVMHGLIIDHNKGSYIENKDSYNRTKDLINGANIKFMHSDILNLKDNFDMIKYCYNGDFRGFDTIYLSNIPEYIDGVTFFNIVKTQLIPLLSDNGVIVYCCLSVCEKSLKQQLNTVSYINSYEMSGGKNPFAKYQLVNDVEGYNMLKSEYDISTDEVDTLCKSNGFDDKDTFVYVKKY